MPNLQLFLDRIFLPSKTIHNIENQQRSMRHRDSNSKPHLHALPRICRIALGTHSFRLSPFIENQREERPDEQADGEAVERNEEVGVDPRDEDFGTPARGEGDYFCGVEEEGEDCLWGVSSLVVLLMGLGKVRLGKFTY